MNRYITYILLFTIGLFSSCIQKDIIDSIPDGGASTSIIFSAQPKGYTPTTVGTKAGETFDPEVFENTIYNAYFMLFDNGGTLRMLENATVSNNKSTVSFSMKNNILEIFPNAKVCFLANVTAATISTFTVNQTTWNDIDNYYFNVTYASSSSTRCIGIPEATDLDGDGSSEYGLPMFGSKIMTSGSYNEPIELERLLARVEIHVSFGIEDNESITTLLSQPQFGLEFCEIHNIPRFIPLTSKSSTAYSTINDDATAKQQLISDLYSTYNLFLGDNKMLYYSSASNPEYKSFYFYTPEHTFGGNLSSNTISSSKSDILETSLNSKKRPIYTKISGYLVDGNGSSYEVCYNIYLGENSTNNFDHFRNKIYKNYIRINGVENGPDVDHRVEKLDKMDDFVDDVSKEGQSANCYIISTTGTYMLPAYRGAYSDLADATMCDVGENVVIACDNPNINVTINQERSKQSTIVFDVSLANNVTLLSGNAVIARMVNNVVDWSWHLWFIPGISYGNNNSDLANLLRIGGLQDEKMYDKTPMANRNIGVTGSATDPDSWIQGTQSGFYYKYGYRQPYFQDVVYGNGAKYHGMNEGEEPISWDNPNVKSVTDPCPPGYRLPSGDIWRGENDKNANKRRYSAHADWLNIDVDAFRYWDRGDVIVDWFGTNDIYYPYSGLITSASSYSNGEGVDSQHSQFKANDYKSFTREVDSTPVKEGDVVPSKADIGVYKWEYETQTYKFTRYRYVEFEYKVILNKLRVGYLWAAGDEYLYYPDKEVSNWNTMEITGCKYQTATVTYKRRRSRSKSLFGSWSSWSEWDDVALSESVGSYGSSTKVTDLNNAPIIGSINNDSWKNGLKDNQSDRFFGLCEIVSFSTPPSEGYQIRCLKEAVSAN